MRSGPVLLDLGTGDGRAVLRAARSDPGRLVVGLDANAEGMRLSSRLAARTPAKGGSANAMFVVARASAPPCELEGIATEITVAFPWGSLLDGMLGRDDGTLSAVAGLATHGALVTMWWSILPRDGVEGVDPAVLRRAWSRSGLEVAAIEAADPTDARSTWGARFAATRAGSTNVIVARRS